VLEPDTFDDGDPLEGSSSRVHINKCTDCIGYRGEEEDGGESRGSDANLDDYDMEDYSHSRLVSYEILPSMVLVSTLWLFCICFDIFMSILWICCL
jgi:hypothetical protein